MADRQCIGHLLTNLELTATSANRERQGTSCGVRSTRSCDTRGATWSYNTRGATWNCNTLSSASFSPRESTTTALCQWLGIPIVARSITAILTASQSTSATWIPSAVWIPTTVWSTNAVWIPYTIVCSPL